MNDNFTPDTQDDGFVPDSAPAQSNGLSGDRNFQISANPFRSDITPEERTQHITSGANTLKSLGLGFIPELLSGATDVSNSLFKGKDTRGESNPYLSIDEKRSLSQAPFLNAFKGGAQAAASLGTPELKLLKGLGPVASAVNKAITGSVRTGAYGFGASTPGNELPYTLAGGTVGAILGPLLAGLSSGMTSESGAWSKIESAASKGKNIDWNEVTDLAKSAAANKSTSVKNALTKLILEETPVDKGTVAQNEIGPAINSSQVGPEMSFTSPTQNQIPNRPSTDILSDRGNIKMNIPDLQGSAEMNGPLRDPSVYSGSGSSPTDITSPNWTSSEALNLRKSLGSRLPNNFFEKLFTKTTPAEQDAINILRRTVSQKLKEAAPEIKTPDQVYSFYKKIHGDAPTWAKRIILAEILKHIGGAIPGAGPLLNELPVP